MNTSLPPSDSPVRPAPNAGDVAKRAGVAISTVSRVFSPRPGVISISAATRERVLAAARELHYVPNRSAGNLRGARTGMISQIIPWNVPELLDTIEREAEERGLAVLTQFTPDPTPSVEAKAIRAALERRVDGIIWMPAVGLRENPDVADLLRAVGPRLVILGGEYPELNPVGSVIFDYAASYTDLITRFAALGLVRLAWFELPPTLEGLEDRYPIFANAAFSLGLDCVRQRVELPDLPRAVAAEMEAARGAARPVLFVGSNIWMAIELQRLVGTRGPAHAVVSLGDMMLGGSYHLAELRGLPSLREPFGQMARDAVAMLHDGRASHPARIHPLRVHFPATEQPSL